MQPRIELHVPWKPIDGSQWLAYYSPADHTFYHGTRGPGKTDCQLQRFRRRVGMGYGRFWRGVIFDREYKNLDDLVSKSKRWFLQYDDGARFLESNSDYKWVWPTGEELLFRAIKTEKDYWNYHGQEFPFIGWNELTKFATSKLFDMMLSCNRSSWTQEKDSERDSDGSFVCDPIPLETFSTGNPYGPGHGWVKRRFIDPAPNAKLVRKSTRVFDPKTQDFVDVETSQMSIYGTYKENPYLDPKYIATLQNEKDPNVRKAWLLGSWDIVAGGAIDDVWRKEIHILPRFVIPQGWRVDRVFDWGSSHPYAVLWFAEANGEEATLPDGSKWCPARGTLIVLWEKYGTTEIGSNVGLKMSAAEISEVVIDAEIALMGFGWIPEQPKPGPADNQIRDVREKDVDTIEKKMADKGVRWTASDKSPGSRKIGLQLFRDRLKAAWTGEGPAFYVMDCCRSLIATVPVLPRDPDLLDDVDTSAEDHIYDCIRYRVLAGSKPDMATDIPVKHVR